MKKKERNRKKHCKKRILQDKPYVMLWSMEKKMNR